MSELVANEYGVEIKRIKVRKLRIHRTGGKWLVEYRREPRLFLFWDHFWWYDDGTYIDYADASARVDTILGNGFVGKAQFQTVKEFEVE